MSLEFYTFTKENKWLSVSKDVLRALVFVLVTFLALRQLPFYPAGIIALCLAVVGLITFIDTRLSIALIGVIIFIPFFFYQSLIAIIFLIAFVSSFEFLTRDKGDKFIMISLAVLLSFIRFELALPVLAAFYFGSTGGILAILMCLSIEIVGLLAGHPLQGLVSTGQIHPIYKATYAVKDFGWAIPHLISLKSAARWINFFKIFIERPYLIMQPILWGGVTAVLGRFVSRKSFTPIWIGAASGGLGLAIIEAAVSGSASSGLSFAAVIGSGIIGAVISGGFLSASLKLKGGEEIKSLSRPEAVMVLDLCSSTEIGDRFGDQFSFDLKSELKEIVESVVGKNQILFKKGTGDGYLMTFPSTENAIIAAREILHKTIERNEAVEDYRRIHLRFGGNFGEVQVARDGDRHGTAVNMAFRLEGVKWDNIVDPCFEKDLFPEKDRVLVSEYMARDIEKMNGLTCGLVGYCEIKGLSGRHPIYKVSPKNVTPV